MAIKNPQTNPSPKVIRDLRLGVDPGYTNVGLSIIGAREDGSPQLLHSRCITAGSAGDLRSFLGATRTTIHEMYDMYPFERWATEVVPVVDNKKTSLHMWFAAGMLWEVVHGLTNSAPLLVSATTVKRMAKRVLGIPAKEKDYITKKQVEEAVLRVTEASSRTNHENDATLVALSAFFPKWITKRDPLNPSNSGPSQGVSIRA